MKRKIEYKLNFSGTYTNISGVTINEESWGGKSFQAKQAFARVIYELAKNMQENKNAAHGLNLYKAINNYAEDMKEDYNFQKKFQTWVRGIRLDLNELQFQSYCDFCESEIKKRNQRIADCRNELTNTCIIAKYFQEKAKDKSKNKKIKAPEVIEKIRQKTPFKDSAANIFNLLEIREDNSFIIKNIDLSNTCFPAIPEDAGILQSDLQAKAFNPANFNEIANDLIKGSNLASAWISIIHKEDALGDGDDDYGIIFLILKTFTLLKIAMGCNRSTRTDFGGKYNWLFPFLIDKDCTQIKSEMQKHIKKIFNDDAGNYGLSIDNNLKNKLSEHKQLKVIFGEKATMIADIFSQLINQE